MFSFGLSNSISILQKTILLISEALLRMPQVENIELWYPVSCRIFRVSIPKMSLVQSVYLKLSLQSSCLIVPLVNRESEYDRAFHRIMEWLRLDFIKIKFILILKKLDLLHIKILPFTFLYL